MAGGSGEAATGDIPFRAAAHYFNQNVMASLERAIGVMANEFTTPFNVTLVAVNSAAPLTCERIIVEPSIAPRCVLFRKSATSTRSLPTHNLSLFCAPSHHTHNQCISYTLTHCQHKTNIFSTHPLTAIGNLMYFSKHQLTAITQMRSLLYTD